MRLRSKRKENEGDVSRLFQRWVAYVLICGLINLGLPQSASAQAPSGGKDAGAADTARSSPKADSEDQRQPSAKQHSRKGGIILTVLGLGVAGAGAALMTRPNSSSCQDGYVYDHGLAYPCVKLSWLDLDRNRKIAGGITIGLGSLMAVVGLLKMKRPRAGSAQPDARRANEATSIETTSR